jgi:hypothetical protein
MLAEHAPPTSAMLGKEMSFKKAAVCVNARPDPIVELRSEDATPKPLSFLESKL